MALTIIPTIRPNDAPIAIEGTNIPAGTLHPYETTTKPMRMTVASRREFAIRHCTVVLPVFQDTFTEVSAVIRLTGKGYHSRPLHSIP